MSDVDATFATVSGGETTVLFAATVERTKILKAMKEWEAFTCLKFKEVAADSEEHAAKFVRNDARWELWDCK